MLTFDTRNIQLDLFTSVTLAGALVALVVFMVALADFRASRRILTTRVEDTTAIIILIVTGSSCVTNSAFCFVGLLGLTHTRASPWLALGALLTGAALDIVCLPIELWLLQRMRRSLAGRAALGGTP